MRCLPRDEVGELVGPAGELFAPGGVDVARAGQYRRIY
jgi:hypothetical protein